MIILNGDTDAQTFTIGVLKVTAILSLGHGAREGEHAPPLVNATTRQDFPHRVRREMGADPCPQAEAGPTPPAKWCGGPRRYQVHPSSAKFANCQMSNVQGTSTKPRLPCIVHIHRYRKLPRDTIPHVLSRCVLSLNRIDTVAPSFLLIACSAPLALIIIIISQSSR